MEENNIAAETTAASAEIVNTETPSPVIKTIDANTPNLIDDDFEVPIVEIDEETLWKVKRAVDEYAKLMESISDTIKDTNPNESKIAKSRSVEINELKTKLDELKIKEQ